MSVLQGNTVTSLLHNGMLSRFPFFYDLIYRKPSYSQEGEDRVLERIFSGQKNGFYVDVGAHHPIRFSNTYIFYLKGWRGINIDPAPGSMHSFNIIRKRDINLEIAVGSTRQLPVFYRLNDPALNTFSKKQAGLYAKKGYRILGQSKIETVSLAEIFKKHLPAETAIDFLSIDVEGQDYDVIQSNDWKKIRPAVVLVEQQNLAGEGIYKSQPYIYMGKNHYVFFAKTFNTLFYIDQRSALFRKLFS